MHNLYARFVLWLIRPALNLRASKNTVDPQVVIDVMLKDLRRNGSIHRAMLHAPLSTAVRTQVSSRHDVARNECGAPIDDI